MNDYPDDATTHKVVDVLRRWEQEVDTGQRAHLAAARRRALAASESRRYRWPTWSGAVTALLLLGLAMLFWPEVATPPDADLLQAALEANPVDFVDVQDVELLMDEDLEFYMWLVSEAEAT